jgi:L-fuculose-phosphate aldolase
MSEVPWTERELRRLMVKACGALAQKNLVAATDGNVTARLSSDRILVTPSGVSKGEIRELDILLCDENGRKIRGRGEISSEIHVHLAAYRAREDIHAVVHAHPPVATAFTFSGMEHLLREPIVPEVVAQIGPIPTAPYATPGTRALAESLTPFFKQCDIVMLAQHGAVALGKDPWRAYLRMEKLEHMAGIIKNARELAGAQAIKILTPEQADELRRLYGKGLLKPQAEKTAPLDVNDALVARIAAEVLGRLGRAG